MSRHASWKLPMIILFGLIFSLIIIPVTFLVATPNLKTSIVPAPGGACYYYAPSAAGGTCDVSTESACPPAEDAECAFWEQGRFCPSTDICGADVVTGEGDVEGPCDAPQWLKWQCSEMAHNNGAAQCQKTGALLGATCGGQLKGVCYNFTPDPFAPSPSPPSPGMCRERCVALVACVRVR